MNRPIDVTYGHVTLGARGWLVDDMTSTCSRIVVDEEDPVDGIKDFVVA